MQEVPDRWSAGAAHEAATCRTLDRRDDRKRPAEFDCDAGRLADNCLRPQPDATKRAAKSTGTATGRAVTVEGRVPRNPSNRQVQLLRDGRTAALERVSSIHAMQVSSDEARYG